MATEIVIGKNISKVGDFNWRSAQGICFGMKVMGCEHVW